MKWKNRAWKIATLAISVPLMLAVSPEIAAVGGLIQALGLELLIPLFEVQLLAIVGYLYKDYLRPVLISADNFISRIDPSYFIPSAKSIYSYPAMLLHTVPGLVSSYRGYMLLKSMQK